MGGSVSRLPKGVQGEIRKQAGSDVGKALSVLGFAPQHRGGGLVNFVRVVSRDGKQIEQSLCLSDTMRDGWGPTDFNDGVALYEVWDEDDGGEPVATFRTVWIFIGFMSPVDLLARR